MALKPAIKRIMRMVPVLVMMALLVSVAPALAASPDIPESQGGIDRIDYNNEVVIDDVLFRLSTETRYYSAQGADILSSQFKKGTTAAYSLAPGSRLVLTLWKIE